MCLLGGTNWGNCQFPEDATATIRLEPLTFFFNCFGTGCGIEFNVRYTKAAQILSLLLYLLSTILVYFIYEPEFGARWRRFLWGKIVTRSSSRGARRVAESNNSHFKNGKKQSAAKQEMFHNSAVRHRRKSSITEGSSISGAGEAESLLFIN